MKLETRSKKLLAITKSKAKMYEFNVDEEHHIELVDKPERLLVPALSILGAMAAYTIRLHTEPNAEVQKKLQDFKSQLATSAQYFDALEQSKLASPYTVYLKILGSAAYYLSDMPGSSSILSSEIPHEIENYTESGIEKFLIWLLSSGREVFNQELSFYSDIIIQISSSYAQYFSGEGTSVDIFKQCDELKKVVYSNGSDRELLIFDVIYAVIIKKIESSSITCLPLYSGLSLDVWTGVLQKESFIREFWPAQKLIGEKGILKGMSAVIQMPTSAGKTKSTELIIRCAFLSDRAKLAVIVAPFRSLCREISDSLSDAFSGEDVTINELVDVPQISESDIEFINLFSEKDNKENASQHAVVVSTPEKLVYILRHQPDLANEIGLLVFDEGHQFDTGSRGVTYELLISSLKRAISNDAQVVLISAVMSNADTIGDWLYGEQGTTVHGAHCLPTHRSIAFATWRTKLGQLKYVNNDVIDNEEYFVPRVIEEINLGHRGKEKKDRIFPDRNSPSKSSHMSSYWGLKLCPQGPVAIFCGAKASINTICKILVEQYSRGLELPSPSQYSDEDELGKLVRLSSLHFGEDSEITAAIQIGVLPHSANIPNGIRLSVEYAMQNNMGRLVVCTSTLAQGVNLPIKYLIVSGIYQGGEKISTRDFHNLIGRAGRSGLHTEGSIIFSSPDIYDKKRTLKGRKAWADIKKLLDFNNSEECVSSLKQIIEPFPEVPGLDVLKFISDRFKYYKLVIKHAEKIQLNMREVKYQLEFRMKAIEAVESYLLSYSSDEGGETSDDFILQIVKNTFAYSMASQKEQELLTMAFGILYEKVLEVPEDRRLYYGKSLLGINDLNNITSWLEENETWRELGGGLETALSCIWPLLFELCNNDKIYKLKHIEPMEIDDAVLISAKCWVSESSYIGLVAKLAELDIGYQWGSSYRAVTIDNVIGLADNVISYDCMLVVGAIADVIEGMYGDMVFGETLRVLQKSLKYGLSNPLSIWLYERGYADRELCKLLTKALVESGVDSDDFKFDILDTHERTINSVLVDYPSYFSQVYK